MSEEISPKDIIAYFGYSSAAEFMAEWRKLSKADKAEIKRLTAIELGKEVWF